MNSCLKFFENAGSVSVLCIQIHHFWLFSVYRRLWPLSSDWSRCLLIVIPSSVTLVLPLLTNVCVWKCIVECVCVLWLCFLSRSSSLTDGFLSASGVCWHLHHLHPTNHRCSHFSGMWSFSVFLSKFSLQLIPIHSLKLVYIRFLPDLHSSPPLVNQITCLLSGRLSAESSSCVSS